MSSCNVQEEYTFVMLYLKRKMKKYINNYNIYTLKCILFYFYNFSVKCVCFFGFSSLIKFSKFDNVKITRFTIHVSTKFLKFF